MFIGVRFPLYILSDITPARIAPPAPTNASELSFELAKVNELCLTSTRYFTSQSSVPNLII